jgi:hypothetical protein
VERTEKKERNNKKNIVTEARREKIEINVTL